ncbi:hypothetical protein TNCV_1573621 [Trichonephila clavipes]|nr:hypothetical protein TNCV_1573621 [Trichonephila clavipes]
MTTTSYHSRSAVGVRHLFSVETLLCCCLGARGTMTTTSYHGRARWVFVSFFRRDTTCCPVASWCTRNDGNDILPQALSGACSSLFPSRDYSAVRLRLVARGTMTTTSYRSRSAVGVRHFFPSRHYSAVRSRVGARGTMSTLSYRVRAAVGVCHLFSVRHYSAVRSRLVHAER